MTEKVKIADLNAAKYNPRRPLTDEERAALTTSLTEFGCAVPIVVNKKGNVIVGGHKRVEVWQEMGNAEIPVVWVNLTKKREKMLNVALNSPLLQADYDNELLQKVLATVNDDDAFSDLRFDELLSGFNCDDRRSVIARRFARVLGTFHSSPILPARIRSWRSTPPARG